MAGPQHIVSAYSEELDRLSADILRMGGLAEAMIKDASRAVVARDAQLAELVIERDLEMLAPVEMQIRASVRQAEVISDYIRDRDVSEMDNAELFVNL